MCFCIVTLRYGHEKKFNTRGHVIAAEKLIGTMPLFRVAQKVFCTLQLIVNLLPENSFAIFVALIIVKCKHVIELGL